MTAPGPFDPPADPAAATHLVLTAGHRVSLWPALLPVPQGWTVAHGPAPHADCERHVAERHVITEQHVTGLAAAAR